MSEISDKRQWYYANGLNKSQCKKVCLFIFGGFLINIKRNDEKLCFDINVDSARVNKAGEVELLDDIVDVEYFRLFWCNKKYGEQWRLIIHERRNNE